ncbi:hypothetical protein AVEN_228642-1 [Araneus ventricosus]|nr:hypothetical protein AVEN_228642-1 [Araneus ventricosus]
MIRIESIHPSFVCSLLPTKCHETGQKEGNISTSFYDGGLVVQWFVSIVATAVRIMETNHRSSVGFHTHWTSPLVTLVGFPKPVAASREESAAAAKEKPEEKKIAWKFGRGGNNQEGWSVRPTPNSGYPLWKKQVASSNGAQPQSDEGAEAAGKTPGNQQAYIVWNVGQGNAPNGWTLKQQPAEIHPNSIEVARPVMAGLGVRVLTGLPNLGMGACTA